MSTECSICGAKVHSKGLCDKHRKRVERHGNPFTVNPTRVPACPTCLKAARVLRRPAETEADATEQLTDLYLLFQTGSDYRLRDRDERGREYDLEEGLTRAN